MISQLRSVKWLNGTAVSEVELSTVHRLTAGSEISQVTIIVCKNCMLSVGVVDIKGLSIDETLRLEFAN